jgi:hypothetical protein
MNQESPENTHRNERDAMLEKINENWIELGLLHKVGLTALTTTVAEKEKIKRTIKKRILGRL